jgi:hypothetical protein
MTAWTIFGVVATAGTLLSLSSCVVWMRLRLRQGEETIGMETEELGCDSAGFFMERYQPMERLLSQEDFCFIQRMPGYNVRIGAQWKRNQRRVFRLYLNELASDFDHLHAAARAMVAVSPATSSLAVGSLIAQKLTFWRSIAAIELRLALPGAVGSINVKPLLRRLEAMRSELEQHATARSAA